MRSLLTITLLFIGMYSQAQEMQTGFTYLETGQYKKAEVFFTVIVKEYPTNKTARLCYGRALGLNGKTTAAKALFTTLKSDYPTDFEVALNYAESLLWNKDYQEARTFYKTLITQQSDSFAALLGYANTLSNLKAYDEALQYVNKALSVQPDNGNALVSRKYMRLGKASVLMQEEVYDPAVMLLEENLVDFPKDQDTQNVLANNYLLQKNYPKAQEVYKTMTDTIGSYTGQALVAHNNHKEKEALELAKNAVIASRNTVDSTKIFIAKERYIQALLWNGKYAQAQQEINKLSVAYPENNNVSSLLATYGLYTGNFKKSIAAYKTILLKDATSFDGNLGIANAYRAQGNLTKAYTYAQKTLEYYPNQKDAKGLINIIENTLSPVVNTNAAYTADNGNNEAYTVTATATIPFSERFKTILQYGYRTTENMVSQEMAYNTNIAIGAHYRVLNNTWLESTLGFVKANAPSNEYTDVNGSLFLTSRPLPLQYLKVGYSRELQNFNASLIDEKIFMNNYSLNYNMGTNINLGWYTGYTYTTQTDGNTRNLLFTSLYYTFTKRPAIKGGINYQYLGFKNQVPTLYFSPSKYQALEAFIDLQGNKGNWSYSANVAGGYQFIENNSATSLFRAEATFTYNISERFQVGGYGKYSTIASETAAGFEFTEVGVKLRWQVLDKPLFKIGE
ncbi:tetratricopeptide repeat protein [Dokdonia sp.]|uniref:tetratricopeptide repeat protein n=1 Tax=Dokdonia sp. TaxID=2024995 RepID=UPI0032666C03